MLLEELLAPIAPENPCGENLEDDPDFVLLHAAAAPKENAQYGEFIGTPEAINWIDIERRCRTLLLRTRDIRLAVLLVRCRVRLGGAEGLLDGLMLLHGLLERYPEGIYPLAVVDGEHDVVMRANALAGLTDHGGILMDIRELSLGKAAGLTMRIRDVEKSLALPRLKDSINPESTRHLLQDLTITQDKNVAALARASGVVGEIEAWAVASMGADAPDLSALTRLLAPFVGSGHNREEVTAPATLAPAVKSEHQNEPPEPIRTMTQEQPQSPETSVPMTRASALATIIEVRQWFESHEPSSPVSVMLRQAERLVGRRFADVVGAIPADLLTQWDATE